MTETIYDKQVYVLAQTLYGEAEYLNELDATAIASVVMNRVRHRLWPNAIAAVCQQPRQFSCWNPEDPNRERIAHPKGVWFTKCLAIARAAANGTLPDPTKGSTHYYATFISRPKWSRGKSPVYKVDHKRGYAHLFFNNIDTKPPETAKDALEAERPLGATRTVVAAKVAGSTTIATPLFAHVDALAPTIPLLQTIAQYAPLVLGVIALAAIGYMLYARIDDRNKGLR